MKWLLGDLYSEELGIKINIKVRQLTRRFANLHIIMQDSFHNDGLCFMEPNVDVVSDTNYYYNKDLIMAMYDEYIISDNIFVEIKVQKFKYHLTLRNRKSDKSSRSTTIYLDLTGEM